MIEGREPEWLKNHPRRSYVRQRILATPPWPGLRNQLRKMYAIKIPGWSWDHDIPLNHPYVCGLHVPANLKRVPHACNAAKNNKWNPFQREMFKFSPQWEMRL